MLTQSVIGVVKALNGLLEKVNSHGEAHLVKQGAPLHQGDVLTLLSGEAYIQFIKGFPEALSLDKPFPLDGISPALKIGALNANEELIQEAIAKGLDPSLILDILGATAAGVEAIGSGGDSFYLDPMYGSGLVFAGFNTLPLSFNNFGVELDPQGIVYTASSDPGIAEPTLTIGISIPLDVINGNFAGDVTEAGGKNNATAGAPVFTGQIISSQAFAPLSMSDNWGSMRLEESGKWTYELSDNSTVVNALKEGEMHDLTVQATLEDGTNVPLLVRIHGVNDAAVPLDDSLHTVKNTSMTFNEETLTVNDSDPEGKALPIYSVISGLGGNVILNSDGTLTFTPEPGFTGKAEFFYTLRDGNIITEPAKVTVDVIGINSVSSPMTTEGNNLVYNISLNGSSVNPISVPYAQFGGTATAGTDYNSTPIFSNGVTLSGGILTIPPGVADFTVTFLTGDDVILEGNESLLLTIDGITGIGTISDTIDVTTLSLSATPSVAEGGNIVYTATLSNPAGTDVSVTLSNGEIITIVAGDSSGTVSVAAAVDDVYVDGSTVSVSIDSATGGNFEQLTVDDTAVATQITDTVDVTTLSLSATPSVAEGGNIFYTAALSNPAGTEMTVTLSNGQIITIAAGTSSGSVTVAAPGDDAYLDPGTVSANITGTTGGNFENLLVNQALVTTSVTDTIDVSTVILSSTSPASVVEGSTITYTATVNNAVTGSPLIVTLSNGQTITIPVGQSSASVNNNVLDDSLFQGDRVLSVSISSTSGGNYESIATIGTVNTTIIDNDTPTLSVNNITVTEGTDGFAVFSVNLSNPSTTAVSVNLALTSGTATGGGTDYGAAGGTNLQVSTNNGAIWVSGTAATIAAGSTSVLVRTPITNDALDEANETFTLTATKIAGTTANSSATGVATIIDNDAFTDANENLTVNEDTTLTGNVLTGTSSINGVVNVTSFTVAGSGSTFTAGQTAIIAGVGTLQIAANGAYTFVPSNDYSGSAPTVTYSMSDGTNSDTSTFSINVTAVADTPVIYAHLSLPEVVAGTAVVNANFSNNSNENNISNWTKVALFDNTFAELQGGNGKTSSEATLFNTIAWSGQTGSNANEVSSFNSRWTKSGGQIIYNSGDEQDDAQGVLILNSNQLTSAERALTNYVITADIYADAGSPQVNGAGIVFSYVNSDNFFLIRWENPSSDYATGGSQFQTHPGQYHELSLVQIVNGVPIDLAQTTFNADDWFNIKVNVSSNGISVLATDTSNSSVTANLDYIYGSISGAAATAPVLTTVGLYSFDNDSDVRWDNIKINQASSYQYILQTEAYLKDTDGSETLSDITLTNIPNGIVLFDTVTNTAVTVINGTAIVTGGHDIRLTSGSSLSTAQINGIIASVTSTETSNGSSATQTTTVNFELIGQYGAETITGTSADEWVYGDDGNDILTGGLGNDVLIGGLGNDTITTGTGADEIFLVKGQGGAGAAAAPIDTITDFALGIDKIVIHGTNITGVAVSTPVSNTYTITVSYSGGAPTEYFKVTLSNGAVLNDSGDTQLTGIVVSGGTATIDGTIVGATLYLDLNANNQEDEGERLGVTDQYGHVEWVVDISKLDVNQDGQYILGEARAVQTGGFDIDTGLSYEINLFGPVGSSVISPLTSLLQAQLEQGLDYSTANANIVAHLGLPTGTDIISLNPIIGTNDMLAQNAAVMTAAVQFAELAALHFSADEGHVSFTVFEAISKALSTLPEGVVADFSDKDFLKGIAINLNLGNLASDDVIEFMSASQKALHTSLETIAAGDNALAAISEVQFLTQGSYAETIEYVKSGYLPSQVLLDLSVIILAYTSSIITYDELRTFTVQFTDVLTPGVDNLLAIQGDGTNAITNYDNDMVQEINTVVNNFITEHNIPAHDLQLVQPGVAEPTDLTIQDDAVIAHEVNLSEVYANQDVAQNGLELHGGSGNDSIYGSDGNDSIFGQGGDDYLFGGKGDDTITGGLGNDVIQGGMGNDVLSGGGGNDIFIFDKANTDGVPAIDTITDFKLNIEGDSSADKSILDLTDLFKDSTLNADSLESLLQISTVHNETTNQTDTVIKTDPTGGAQFGASPETIVLSGVDVVSAYGTADSAEIVSQMLAANIIVMVH